jgi:hypothetical protein
VGESDHGQPSQPGSRYRSALRWVLMRRCRPYAA